MVKQLGGKGIQMLKKICVFLLLVLTIYSVYYDLNIGTLPTTNASTTIELQSEEDVESVPFVEVTVEAGYTVLSIVEQLHYPEKIEVSIQQIINDFEYLNTNVSAHEIQMGRSYLFPLYQ